jgi:hypothetical protein
MKTDTTKEYEDLKRQKHALLAKQGADYTAEAYDKGYDDGRKQALEQAVIWLIDHGLGDGIVDGIRGLGKLP